MENAKKIGRIIGKGKIINEPLTVFQNGKKVIKFRVGFDIMKIQTKEKNYDYDKRVYTFSISDYATKLMKGESVYLIANLIEKKDVVPGGTHILIYGEVTNLHNNSLILNNLNGVDIPPWLTNNMMPNMN